VARYALLGGAQAFATSELASSFSIGSSATGCGSAAGWMLGHGDIEPGFWLFRREDGAGRDI